MLIEIWKLFLNQVDLEVGNRYWIRKTFNIRPYFGLRGAWTRTNFVVKGVKTENRTVPLAPGVASVPGVYNIMKNHFKNTFWGVGLLGGLEPEFRFSKNFGLYGNISGALLWGKYKAENRLNFFQDIPISVGGTTFNQIAIANPKETDYNQMVTFTKKDMTDRFESILYKLGITKGGRK